MSYDPNYLPPNPGPYAGYDPATLAAMYGAPRRHGGIGIASFVISIIAAIGIITLLIIASVMMINAGGKLDEKSPAAITVGCSVFVFILAAVVGLILGIVAALQQNTKRLFGILGLCFNLGILLVLGVLFVIGLATR